MIKNLYRLVRGLFYESSSEMLGVKEETLRNSDLLSRLKILSLADPLDIDDTKEVLRLLAESVCHLIPAIDENKIHFDNDQSKAAFFQILSVSYELTRRPTHETHTRH